MGVCRGSSDRPAGRLSRTCGALKSRAFSRRRTFSEQSFHTPSARALLSLAWTRESRQREVHPGFVHRSHGERCALRSLPSTGRRQLGHPWPSGPLPDGNRPEETPAGTRARCARAERRHTDVPSRGPEGGLRTRRADDGMDAGGRATQGAVAGSPQSVWPGWPSLWLHFSDSGHPALRPPGQLRCSRRSCGAVATQEKVTRAPEACESSVLTMAEDAIKLALKGGPKRLGTYPCPRAGTGAPQTCESFGAK